MIRGITEGSAIAVSGGSINEEWGATAVTPEVNNNARHRIKATSTAPGTSKYQDSHKSDLTGLYHMIYIIDTIWEKHGIRSRGITAGYDRINTIKNPCTPTLHIHVSQITSTSSRPSTKNSLKTSNLVTGTREGTSR